MIRSSVPVLYFPTSPDEANYRFWTVAVVHRRAAGFSNLAPEQPFVCQLGRKGQTGPDRLLYGIN